MPWKSREEPEGVLHSQIRFLYEQNGGPERDLKAILVQLFNGKRDVERAYLARIEYSEGMSYTVALCLRTVAGENRTLVQEIGTVFRSLFGQNQHLDVIFLSESLEKQVTAVCEAFYIGR